MRIGLGSTTILWLAFFSVCASGQIVTKRTPTGGSVGGASSLTTVNAIPKVASAGVLTESMISCTGSPLTCTVYDPTAATGDTVLALRDGAAGAARIKFGTGGTYDLGLSRSSAGILEHNSGTAGKWAGVKTGSIAMQSLATPVITSVTPTCVGTCTATWTYKVVAYLADGTTATAASAASSTAVQDATLDANNYNTVLVGAVTGATSYTFYRTVSGGTPATVGALTSCTNIATLTCVDNGLVGDTTTPPTGNSTGSITIPGKLGVGGALGSGAADKIKVYDAGGTNTFTQVLDGTYVYTQAAQGGVTGGIITSATYTGLYQNGPASAPQFKLDNTGAGIFTVSSSAPKYFTTANCASGASPSVCAAASAGAVALPAGGTTLTVNTTAVNAASRILITENTTVGTELSVTCNTTIARTYAVTTITAGTSFVITTSAAPVTDPACLNFMIVN